MGLLGIIVELEIPIIPDKVVIRKSEVIDQQEILEDIAMAKQNASLVDEHIFWWYPALGRMVRTQLIVSSRLLLTHEKTFSLFIFLFHFYILFTLIMFGCCEKNKDLTLPHRLHSPYA